MRILYVATIASTLNFFPKHIEMLKNSGAVIELASNFEVLDKGLQAPMQQLGCVQIHIPFSRSPLSADNVEAYRQLKKVLAEGDYDIVHTHTPNSSAVVRLACWNLRRQGLRVFYTAHGFHFYKGAPLKNWLLYYPVEWVLSYLTDVLITINEEDYARAKKRFHAKKVEYMPGVGLDFAKFDIRFLEEDRRAKRTEIGVPEQAKLLVSVGELNRNKNHEVIIRALAKINDPNLHYCIAGRGELEGYLTSLANELGVGAQAHLLGFRNDVPQLYKSADVCCFPSIREGLGMAVLEGIVCGLPVVAADNRGTRDIIVDGESGILCPPNDADAFAAAIRTVLDQPERVGKMSKSARKNAERFAVENALNILRGIYQL